MTEWTLQKSEHEEDTDYPWSVVEPDGGFTDFESWKDALDFLEEKLEEQESD